MLCGEVFCITLKDTYGSTPNESYGHPNIEYMCKFNARYSTIGVNKKLDAPTLHLLRSCLSPSILLKYNNEHFINQQGTSIYTPWV